MRATLGTGNISCCSVHAFIVAVIINKQLIFQFVFLATLDCLKGQCGLVPRSI